MFFFQRLFEGCFQQLPEEGAVYDALSKYMYFYIDGAVLKSRKRKKPTFQEMQKKKDFKCCIAYFDC